MTLWVIWAFATRPTCGKCYIKSSITARQLYPVARPQAGQTGPVAAFARVPWCAAPGCPGLAPPSRVAGRVVARPRPQHHRYAVCVRSNPGKCRQTADAVCAGPPHQSPNARMLFLRWATGSSCWCRGPAAPASHAPGCGRPWPRPKRPPCGRSRCGPGAACQGWRARTGCGAGLPAPARLPGRCLPGGWPAESIELLVTQRRDVAPDTLGLVRVDVGTKLLKRGGFTFELPAQAVQALQGASQAVATLPDGTVLPDWLHFDPRTLAFKIDVAPARALPLMVLVRSNGLRVLVEIVEMQ